ncbi:transcriptional repressor LexA [Candidatus Falkowbacteria bacterium]|nr:transcriptional repressor LexA [Candidatus Falkowbacteria bacterium]
MGLTKKQYEMLEFIQDFIIDHGYAPSFREIAGHFKLSSVATVAQHIGALEAKGYLRRTGSGARAIELIPTDEGELNIGEIVNLPLMGLIAAGQPIEAIANPEMIAIPANLVLSRANSYVLQVKGESMIEDGILDGDYVVVERNPSPSNGDTVVALLDNAYATLKKFYREAGRIRLQPANKTLNPIYVKDPLIQGIVRAVIRNFKKV